MLNNEVWTDRYVKFTNAISHKGDSKHYPPVNTLGLVIIEDDCNSIFVQWKRNTTSDDDMWWCFKTNVEIMPEVNSENVLRYGWVITDDAFDQTVAEFGQRNAIRIRVISYCDKLYYHKMIDGEVIDFKVIGQDNA